jgi:uncharacterized integral membrane protein
MREDVDEHAGAVHRHDAAKIFRWLIVAAIVVAIVVVARDNRTDTRVGYAIGDAEAPIWVVILLAGLAGMIIGWLVSHRSRSHT